MDVSPYLNAIQSLKGQNPHEKYKELHLIAIQIAENDKETAELVSHGVSERVQPALLSHLRILVGKRLKQSESVVEALKSDNVVIVKQALGARWFFNGANPLINVDYFVANITPYVSMRTRLQLIKTLAHCLMNEPEKANDFFDRFATLYGLEQATQLIVACSEQHAFESILQRRMILPSRILSVLYRRYPQLVIRYLQLGNEKNEKNKEERKIHKISLENYVHFLPILVTRHTQEFVELYECLPEYKRKLTLGGTRSEYFLKNATGVLIGKPQIFLDILPLKLVSNKLTTQQFENMFENLFPKKIENLYVSIFDYLKYYPQEKKLTLIRDKYKLLYNKDLLEATNILRLPIYYQLIPLNIKEEIARKTIEPFTGTPKYYDYVYQLPPKESIPLLKERISKSLDVSRLHWFTLMLTSCQIYDSKDGLLEALRFYNMRYKNDRADVLDEMLTSLIEKFNIKDLEKSHWQVLKDIIQRAYVKGDLYLLSWNTYDIILNGALLHFLKQSKADGPENEDDKVFVNKLIGMIVEGHLGRKMKWTFDRDYADVEKECLQKFLTTIPQKYPEEHEVWRKQENKLNTTLDLLRAMRKHNIKNSCVKTKRKYKAYKDSEDSSKMKQWKFMIKDYSWLMNFARDLIKSVSSTSNYYQATELQIFRTLLRRHDPETYQNFIDQDPESINDIESSDALAMLKHNHNKILAKWSQYLTACRRRLSRGSRSTRHFVAATKWHQEIPIKFVERCLLEIEESGSAFVLGILLEGEVLGKIIEPYLPKDNKLNIEDEDAKKTYQLTASLPKVINSANPPVSFDIIASFCQGDFVSLAAQTLTNVAQRVPVNRVMTFASQLVNKPISVKKLAIRLVFQVATKNETREFLKHMWRNEKHLSIRELVATMIFDVFQQTPSAETWDLIKVCINGLTENDKTIFDALGKIKVVDKKYVVQYIEEILKKIDQFNESEMDENTKSRLIVDLIDKIDENVVNQLPERTLTDILERQFFNYSATFILKSYLLSNEDKFEERLKTIMKILENEINNLDVPHPELTRFYPANQRLQCFFRKISDQIVHDKYKNSLRLINNILKLFETVLKPWRQRQAYVSLILCREFFDPKVPATPEEFGARCGKKLDSIVKAITTEMAVRDIAKVLCDTTYFQDIDSHDFELSVIEGLMEGDNYFGSIVGINVLKLFNLSSYDDRYDKFIKIWHDNPNSTVQATLSGFTNEICQWTARRDE